MHFSLVDRVLELTPTTIVTLKLVSSAEEYLQDHFATFPVLPGVFMLEAMVQSARALLTQNDPALARHVLGTVRAFKYGSFVRPGAALRCTVSLTKSHPDGFFDFTAAGVVLEPGAAPTDTPPVAASGKFSMRPVRVIATMSAT